MSLTIHFCLTSKFISCTDALNPAKHIHWKACKDRSESRVCPEKLDHEVELNDVTNTFKTNKYDKLQYLVSSLKNNTCQPQSEELGVVKVTDAKHLTPNI